MIPSPTLSFALLVGGPNRPRHGSSLRLLSAARRRSSSAASHARTMKRSRSCLCCSACRAELMNASNVLNLFGALGNLPNGSANVSKDVCEMFGRNVCWYCCDEPWIGKFILPGGCGNEDSKLAGRISFCSGCSVVALLSVEMRFSRRAVGGRVTGGGRGCRGLRRKRRKGNMFSFALSLLLRVVWGGFGC